MRLYPPVPIIARKITEDLKLRDYIVPKGSSLYLLIGRLHMDPNVFERPLDFKPERFINMSYKREESPFCFTPFSAGPRSCIGQKFALNEMKIVLSKVLINFNIKSLDNRNDVIVLNSIVSKPTNGIRVQIFDRIWILNWNQLNVFYNSNIYLKFNQIFNINQLNQNKIFLNLFTKPNFVGKRLMTVPTGTAW